MKSLAILLAASLATASGLRAQDMITSEEPAPAVEEVPAGEPAATSDPAMDDLPATSEPGDAGLLVEPLPPLPDTSTDGRLKVPSVKPEQEEEPATNWRDEMKLRQLQTKFEADPALVELKQAAASATRDSEKRMYLLQYYGALFAKINKADPSLTEIVAKHQESKERDLIAEQIEPSVAPGQTEAPTRIPTPMIKETKKGQKSQPKPAAAEAQPVEQPEVKPVAAKPEAKPDVTPEAMPEEKPPKVKAEKVKPEKKPKKQKSGPSLWYQM